MLRGPERLQRYSSPIAALLHQELASVLSVTVFCTVNTARICR